MTAPSPRPAVSPLAEEIVLASASPRREALLRAAGYRFRAVAPEGVSEEAPGLPAAERARRAALAKALAVARSIDRGYVLGADTLVDLSGEVLGKPRDAREAQAMLGRLGGVLHRVVTGVAVVDAGSGRVALGAAESLVRLARLDRDALSRYVASGAWEGKAGGYAAQDEGSPVEEVVGSFSNVVGLPLEILPRLFEELRTP